MNRKKQWTPTWSDDYGAWIVDFRMSDQRVRRRLPIRDPGLKSIAEKEAIETYRSAWESAGESLADKSKMTFHEAAERYVAQGGEERFLSRIVKYIDRKVLVDDIRPADVARAVKILYRDAKPETVRRQLHVPIKAVQNFAAGRRRSKIPDTRRTRWLTPEEAERLLTAAAYPDRVGLRDPNRETLRKIAFMLGTGASPGETMSARGENWNLTTREWWLSGTKTVYRAQYVRLPTRAVELTGKILEEGPAFPAPNGVPYKFNKNRGGQMAVAFRKIRDAARLDEFICLYSLATRGLRGTTHK